MPVSRESGHAQVWCAVALDKKNEAMLHKDGIFSVGGNSVPGDVICVFADMGDVGGGGAADTAACEASIRAVVTKRAEIDAATGVTSADRLVQMHELSLLVRSAVKGAFETRSAQLVDTALQIAWARTHPCLITDTLNTLGACASMEALVSARKFLRRYSFDVGKCVTDAVVLGRRGVCVFMCSLKRDWKIAELPEYELAGVCIAAILHGRDWFFEDPRIFAYGAIPATVPGRVFGDVPEKAWKKYVLMLAPRMENPLYPGEVMELKRHVDTARRRGWTDVATALQRVLDECGRRGR